MKLSPQALLFAFILLVGCTPTAEHPPYHPAIDSKLTSAQLSQAQAVFDHLLVCIKRYGDQFPDSLAERCHDPLFAGGIAFSSDTLTLLQRVPRLQPRSCEALDDRNFDHHRSHYPPQTDWMLCTDIAPEYLPRTVVEDYRSGWVLLWHLQGQEGAPPRLVGYHRFRRAESPP